MTSSREMLERMPELRAKQRRWDLHFLQLALVHSKMSKDPRTRVGAVVVGLDREVRSMGFNGFPRGLADHEHRLNSQSFCDECMVHAERNAILAAARVGVPLAGCVLYLAATDDSGAIWGGPPCVSCAIEIIQAGIIETVAFPFKSGPSRWAEKVKLAGAILVEAGVTHREIAHE